MRRRTLLARAAGTAATGTLLAGCLDAGSDDEEVDPVVEDPRTDEPPYEIEVPEFDDDVPPSEREEAWNDDYLGEHMPTEPSLRFERIPYRLGDAYRLDPEFDRRVFRVTLIEDREELERGVDTDRLDDDERERLAAIDFAESVVVVVQSGFGSGSVGHRWARVEAVEDGVHLHGYYAKPWIRTDDLASRASVLEVERPDDGLDLARVSLTTDETTRVHFNSTEGLVELD